MISLAGETDSSMGQALARLDLARFLGPVRREEAVALARVAFDLVEAKGATIYATAARDLLVDLDASA